MAENREETTKTLTLREYSMPTFTDNSATRRHAIAENNFEIKPAVVQLVQANQFSGLFSEDPYAHIAHFLEICDIVFKKDGVTEDAIRLRLFSFSLRDHAMDWLFSLPTGRITTWDALAQKFLEKFFTPAKTAKMRHDIRNFIQFDMESIHEAWERYRDLLRRCPHHGFLECVQLQFFYDGLGGSTKTLVNIAARGSLMAKPTDEAYDLLELMAANEYGWPTERTGFPRGVDKPSLGYDHLPPQSNPRVNKVSLEDAMAQLTMNIHQFMDRTDTTLQNQSASIKNLELQVGRIANMVNSRARGSYQATGLMYRHETPYPNFEDR